MLLYGWIWQEVYFRVAFLLLLLVSLELIDYWFDVRSKVKIGFVGVFKRWKVPPSHTRTTHTWEVHLWVYFHCVVKNQNIQSATSLGTKIDQTAAVKQSKIILRKIFQSATTWSAEHQGDHLKEGCRLVSITTCGSYGVKIADWVDQWRQLEGRVCSVLSDASGSWHDASFFNIYISFLL